tara:strand:+ start:1424 stop:2647 length:1224 start_codon:yes stop_codon:yes gene_type:complete
MKIKVLHVVGGPLNYGASKGANILHKALLELDVESKLLNDSPTKVSKKNIENFDKNIIFINNNFFTKLISKIFIYLEKILKLLYFNRPSETFTLGFFGFDITKLKEYKDADIIHLHWLNQGFVKLKYLSKIDKPLIWTMRDMWAFTGGSHYSMGFEKYETSFISKIIRSMKKNNYSNNFNFVAVSNWLRNEAKKSDVLKKFNIEKIDNNIEFNKFSQFNKFEAKKKLNILTEKKILLYGAQNPQSKRKGWDIFVKTLKELDKSKYFLLIFGNFWSHKTLDDIGIEYKSLGYIDSSEKLNLVYCCGDLFIATSIQDAWPKTFAEAMSSGTPVICFDNTSISEIISHKLNGYIVDNFSSEELKQGIDWFFNDENIRLNFGENARNKAKEFDSKKVAKKYIDLYKTLLNK